jgi:hypothetical protein
MSMIAVKYTKTAIGDPALMKRLEAPMAIAVATAYCIRDRIVGRGMTVTPANAYRSTATAGGGQSNRGKRQYYISPSYASKIGIDKQTRWDSSAEMHGAVSAISGTANVSGGMWAGLQIRNSGDRAIIEFGGSSLGASSTLTAKTTKKTGTFEVTLSADGRTRARQVRELKRSEGGEVQYRRKPKLVRNSEKAGRVYRNSRVGLLQLTASEDAAQREAFRDAMDRIAAKLFGRKPMDNPISGDPKLYRAILAAFGV